jgi:hypothetical protein
MPVEVVRLADSSMSLKAQPIDMPHGGWCKPPARPVVMIYLYRINSDTDALVNFHRFPLQIVDGSLLRITSGKNEAWPRARQIATEEFYHTAL